jgi:hypothetical protein
MVRKAKLGSFFYAAVTLICVAGVQWLSFKMKQNLLLNTNLWQKYLIVRI